MNIDSVKTIFPDNDGRMSDTPKYSTILGIISRIILSKCHCMHCTIPSIDNAPLTATQQGIVCLIT